MKYLNSFKLFEDSKSKPSIDDYVELSHILMDDIFDNMNIVSQTTESFNDSEPPTNKFWAFSKESSGLSSKVDSEKINLLTVFNLGELEIEEFMNTFDEEYINEIESIIGYKLLINKDKIYNEFLDCYFYDVVFKLKSKDI